MLRLLLATNPACADTPLHAASATGQLHVVKWLLRESGLTFPVQLPDDVEQTGRYPIHSAAKNGDLKAVRFWITEQKVDVDIADANGWTPLFWAAAGGHGNLVIALLYDLGAEPQKLSNASENAADVARANGHQAIADCIRTFVTVRRESYCCR